MRLKIFLVLAIITTLWLTSCQKQPIAGQPPTNTPPEKYALTVVTGAKAFIDQMKSHHPECPAATSNLCVNLTKATAAKDALIDAAELFCSGPSFENGGVCQPPVQGTPAYQQALAKMKAANAAYNQIETDVRTVAGAQ